MFLKLPFAQSFANVGAGRKVLSSSGAQAVTKKYGSGNVSAIVVAPEHLESRVSIHQELSGGVGRQNNDDDDDKLQEYHK